MQVATAKPSEFITKTATKLSEAIEAGFDQKAASSTINWLSDQIITDGKGYENIQVLESNRSEILDIIAQKQDKQKFAQHKQDIINVIDGAKMIALTKLDKSNEDLSCHTFRMGFVDGSSLEALENALASVASGISIKSSELAEPDQKRALIELVAKAAKGTITQGNDFAFSIELQKQVSHFNHKAQKDNKFITAKVVEEIQAQVQDSKNELPSLATLNQADAVIIVDSILQGAVEGFDLGSGADILTTNLEKIANLPESQVLGLAKEAAKNKGSHEKISNIVTKFQNALAKEVQAVNEANADNGQETSYTNVSQIVNDEQRLNAINKALEAVQDDVKALEKGEQALLKTSALKKKSADYTKKHGDGFGKLFFAGMMSKVGFAAIIGMALSLLGGGFMMPAIVAFLGACAAGVDAGPQERQAPPEFKKAAA